MLAAGLPLREAIAAALIVCSLPKNEIDTVIIAEAFGEEVTALVNGVLRAGRIENIRTGHDKGPSVETLRKMLLAMADDVRVVLIKLAERVVYMRSITKSEDAVRNAAGVREKFGVEPARIPDLLALVGDAADGYPGIPGIGKVTAARRAPISTKASTTTLARRTESFWL